MKLHSNALLCLIASMMVAIRGGLVDGQSLTEEELKSILAAPTVGESKASILERRLADPNGDCEAFKYLREAPWWWLSLHQHSKFDYPNLSRCLFTAEALHPVLGAVACPLLDAGSLRDVQYQAMAKSMGCPSAMRGLLMAGHINDMMRSYESWGPYRSVKEVISPLEKPAPHTEVKVAARQWPAIVNALLDQKGLREEDVVYLRGLAYKYGVMSLERLFRDGLYPTVVDVDRAAEGGQLALLKELQKHGHHATRHGAFLAWRNNHIALVKWLIEYDFMTLETEFLGQAIRHLAHLDEGDDHTEVHDYNLAVFVLDYFGKDSLCNLDLLYPRARADVLQLAQRACTKFRPLSQAAIDLGFVYGRSGSDSGYEPSSRAVDLAACRNDARKVWELQRLSGSQRKLRVSGKGILCALRNGTHSLLSTLATMDVEDDAKSYLNVAQQRFTQIAWKVYSERGFTKIPSEAMMLFEQRVPIVGEYALLAAAHKGSIDALLSLSISGALDKVDADVVAQNLNFEAIRYLHAMHKSPTPAAYEKILDAGYWYVFDHAVLYESDHLFSDKNIDLLKGSRHLADTIKTSAALNNIASRGQIDTLVWVLETNPKSGNLVNTETILKALDGNHMLTVAWLLKNYPNNTPRLDEIFSRMTKDNVASAFACVVASTGRGAFITSPLIDDLIKRNLIGQADAITTSFGNELVPSPSAARDIILSDNVRAFMWLFNLKYPMDLRAAKRTALIRSYLCKGDHWGLVDGCLMERVMAAMGIFRDSHPDFVVLDFPIRVSEIVEKNLSKL